MKNKHGTLHLVVFSFLCFLSVSISNLYAKNISIEFSYTQASTSNIRAENSANAEIVHKLPINTKVRILEKSGEWVSIQLAHNAAIHGWVHQSLLGTRPIRLGNALSTYKRSTKNDALRLQWIERAAAIAPHDINILKELAQTLNQQGNTEKAIEILASIEQMELDLIEKTQAVKRLPFENVSKRSGSLSVSADGKIAAHITESGEVVVWNTQDLKVIFRSQATENRKAVAIALDSVGAHLGIGFHTIQIRTGPYGALSYRSIPIQIWSLTDHKVVREFEIPNQLLNSLAFSDDGSLLAAGMKRKSIVWDARTGSKIREFPVRLDAEGWDAVGTPIDVGFTENGRALVVSELFARHYDTQRGVAVWDISTGLEILSRHVAPTNHVDEWKNGMALGANGSMLVFPGRAGLEVERLDGCDIPPTEMRFGGYADTVAAALSGHWVAAVEEGLDGYNLKLAKPSSINDPIVYPMPLLVTQIENGGHEHLYLLVGYKADQQDIYSQSKGRIYKLALPRSLTNNKNENSFDDNPVLCRKELEGRARLTLKIPERPDKLVPKATLSPERNNDVAATDLHFDSQGTLYALYTEYEAADRSEDYKLNQGILAWDSTTYELIHANQGVWVRSRDPLRLGEGWGHYDGSKNLESYVTGEKYQIPSEDFHYTKLKIDLHNGDLYFLRKGYIDHYSKDGKHIQKIKFEGNATSFTAHNGRIALLISNNVLVWQTDKKPLKEPAKYHLSGLIEDPEYSEDLELSSDGKFLLVDSPNASGDGPTGHHVYRLSNGEHVGNGGMFVPGANRGVVSGRYADSLDVWDYDQGKVIAHVPVHAPQEENDHIFDSSIIKISISDNGRFLASAARDGSIRIWDIDERKLVGEAQFEKDITAIAFNADGSIFAVGTADRNVQLFKISAPKS